MTSTIEQPELLLQPDRDRCDHRSGFDCRAYVPAGSVCCECGLLLLQFLPESPDALGYLSADWAWHYRDGKPWTTQNDRGAARVVGDGAIGRVEAPAREVGHVRSLQRPVHGAAQSTKRQSAAACDQPPLPPNDQAER